MAEFNAEVFQNEYLPDGGTDVHAIVSVSCTGAGEAGRAGAGDAAEIIIVDCSGSMARGEDRRRPPGGGRRRRRDRSTAPGSPSSPATDAADLAFPDPSSRMVADGRPTTGRRPRRPSTRLQANGRHRHRQVAAPDP